MADIDMIPRSYRDGVRLRRALRRTGAALGAIVLCAAAGHGALRWGSAGIDQQSAALRAAAGAAQSNLARVATEHEAQAKRQQHAALLHTLRREGELAALAQAIEGALPANAWLTAVTLRRGVAPAAEAAAAPEGAPAVEAAGTLVADGQLRLVESSIELAGQAAGYEEVTDFLARLGRMPGPHQVALASSGANPTDGAIDFRAALTLSLAPSAPAAQVAQ